MPRMPSGLAQSLLLAVAVLVAADGQFTAACGQPAAPHAWPTLSPVQPAASQTGIAVPSSIDATGRRDASRPLMAWLATVPDGSTIRFKPRGVYRLDVGIQLNRRSDLTFEGNGATLKSHGARTCGRACSIFYLFRRNSGITIRNMNLVGNSPTPGVYDSAIEQAHAVAVIASHDVEITNVRIRSVGGDGLYVSAWSDGVWFHDSRVLTNGRMGVAITAGRNVTVERVSFDKVGYGAFDIEPNDSAGGATDIKFINNRIGSITMPPPKGFFFGANGAIGSTVSSITVKGNKIAADALYTSVSVPRRQQIVFEDNEALVGGHGPILRFAHVDGLAVSGIVQPLCSGVLTSVWDSTGVAS